MPIFFTSLFAPVPLTVFTVNNQSIVPSPGIVIPQGGISAPFNSTANNFEGMHIEIQTPNNTYQISLDNGHYFGGIGGSQYPTADNTVIFTFAGFDGFSQGGEDGRNNIQLLLTYAIGGNFIFSSDLTKKMNPIS